MTRRPTYVYALASGSYSDYRIHCTFGSGKQGRALATRTLARCNGDSLRPEYRIERLLEYAVDPERFVLYSYAVQVEDSPEAVNLTIDRYQLVTWDWEDLTPGLRRGEPEVRVGGTRRGRLWASGRGTDLPSLRRQVAGAIRRLLIDTLEMASPPTIDQIDEAMRTGEKELDERRATIPISYDKEEQPSDQPTDEPR